MKVNSITMITAFYDIRRETWGVLNRDVEYYIDSLKKLLILNENMIIFMDDKYIQNTFIREFINELKLSNNNSKKFIFINDNWLNTYSLSWQKNSISEKIMKSENYIELANERIIQGSPETIYSEYNTINHSKIDYIKYAIDNHLIADNEFICWCDFGYYNSILHNNPLEFPYAELDINKFNIEKLNFCIRNKITEKDGDMVYTLKYGPEVFTGSFFAGNKRQMLLFHTLYHESLDDLYNNNISDDDQHVVLRCYLKDPNLFQIYWFNDNKWPQALSKFQLNFNNRFDLINHYINKYKSPIMVEIGVCHGTLSEFLLTNNKSSYLYCVDPYISYNEYVDACNTEVNDTLFLSTRERLTKKFNNRVSFIRKFSDNAIDYVPNNLDFIYIDGNHKYEYVYNDLENWFKKLKKGGLIICDDASDTDDSKRDNEGNVFIQWNENSFGDYGVMHACKVFTKKYNIPFFIFQNQILIFKPFNI
jgi:hypothetical protein